MNIDLFNKKILKFSNSNISFTEEEQATSLMIMNLYKVKNDTFKIAYNFTDDYKEKFKPLF